MEISVKDSVTLLNEMQSLLNQNPSLHETAQTKLESLLKELGNIKKQEELPLRLRNIQELKGLHFFVDAYQRSYKWTKHQVIALLEDIHEFTPNQSEDYYCLQPIVVKKQKVDGQEYLELIDGQQRMTTIYIILAYLTKNSFFKLRYETRKDSSVFLNHHIFQLEDCVEQKFDDYVQDQSQLNNIDNYYFFSAYQNIQKWFLEQEKTGIDIRDEWINKLLHSTKVIWYQVENQANQFDDKEQSIEIFQRINQGKISLTNAELLKALFLNTLKYETTAETFKIRQSEMANQWDTIEHALQNPDFWAFVCPHDQANVYTRIELLFDLLSEKFVPSKTASHWNTLAKKQEYYTFQYFADQLQSNHNQTVSALWKIIQQGFYRLNEWFLHDESYHLIGFIVGQKIKTITELWVIAHKESKREAFQIRLKQIIALHIRQCFGQTHPADQQQPLIFDDLNYGDKTQHIILLILLLNLDLHRQQGTRFPFKSYHALNTIWSLEHIHAQKSKVEEITNLEHWYNEQQDILAHVSIHDVTEEKQSDLRQALNTWYSNKTPGNIKLYLDLQQEYLKNFLEQRTHKLDNLCLLDKRDNSVLSNKVFYEKRYVVMDLQKTKRRFIPIATQWAFAKYFNSEVEDFTIWSQKDRQMYRSALIQCWEYYQSNLFGKMLNGEQA